MEEPICEIVKEYKRLSLPTEDDLPYEARQECIRKCMAESGDNCDCVWFAKNGGPGAT